MKASKIAAAIEKEAPLNLQESWDNSGFQLGSRRQDIESVLTVLDITPDVIKKALETDKNMIVSHHPLFFRGLKSIDTDTTKGKMIEDLIKNSIVVYSAHTSLDKGAQGLNYTFAKLLGLENIKPLKEDKINSEKYYKFSVYIPEEIREDCLNLVEALEIGKTDELYSSCTFSTPGKGTFKALEEAKPFIGEKEVLEEVNELKLETVVEESKIPLLLKELKKIHPYEVFAYDLFELNLNPKSKNEGLGVIGTYPQKLSSKEFIKKLKEITGLEFLREAGPRTGEIKKVALCTGAGAEFIRSAKSKKADVYITGDLKHHEAQLAMETGIWVIDAGHYGTEKHAPLVLKEIIEKSLGNEITVEAFDSQDYINLI